MNILIVDDEPLVRGYIRSLLERQHGQDILCAEAVSGEDALAQLALDMPDIALVDVRMPGMGGVALVREMAARHPQVACVMLSGHDDFEYVHDSMLYGAQEYLLKHRVTRELLWEAILKVMQNRQQKLQTEATARVALPLLRERVLRAAVFGEPPASDAPQIWQGLLEPFAGETRLILLDINKTDLKVELTDKSAHLHQRVQHMAQEALGRGSPIVPVGETRFVMLGDAPEDACQRITVRVGNALRLFLNLRCAFTISDAFRSLADCAAMYQQAQERLEATRLIAGLTIAQTERLFGALASGNELFLRMECAQIFRNIGPVRSAATERIIEDVLSLLWLSAEQSGLDADTLLQPELSALRARDSAEAIVQALTQMTLILMRALDTRPGRKHHSSHITRAIAHIHANIASPLALEGVAAHVSVSPSYLSRLFREECDCTFTEYVNRMRVDLAGRYLRRGKSAREASELVGFANPSYFFRVFKHVMGCTPTEFVKDEKIVHTSDKIVY